MGKGKKPVWVMNIGPAGVWKEPFQYTGNSNMSPGCFDFVLFESQLPAGELIQNFENDITLSVFIHIQKSNWIG